VQERIVFTGIIEEVGQIKDLRFSSNGAVVTVASKIVSAGLKTGDSISINGVCLTATGIGTDFFTCDISSETLQHTTFQKPQRGAGINLERALLVGDRLGGHFVLGHVDDTGRLAGRTPVGEGFEMSFDFPQKLERYLVHKGSIAVNGISLTIASLGKGTFSVAVIPHTYKSTNLSQLTIGDPVNLEVDILGKYFERFFQLGLPQGSNTGTKLTSEYFKGQGF
jgi:riboflavin synthase